MRSGEARKGWVVQGTVGKLGKLDSVGRTSCRLEEPDPPASTSQRLIITSTKLAISTSKKGAGDPSSERRMQQGQALPSVSRLHHHPSFNSETSATRLYSVGRYSSVLRLAWRVGSRGAFCKAQVQAKEARQVRGHFLLLRPRPESSVLTPWHDWEHYQRNT